LRLTPLSVATKYERGRDAEYRVQKELEAELYQTARMAGSHGTADVIAWKNEHIRFIQVKTWVAKYTPRFDDDIAKLKELKLPPGATAELWGRKVGQSGWTLKIIVQET
jgi:Holliday junction resolvase-like predicted endonuclease